MPLSSIIAFFIVLLVLVLAHEFGHFITAKLSGVRVDEFAFGFPPRLLAFKHGETTYSFNAIPLGGFTKLAGEEDPKVPRSLASKGIRTRLLILSAGSIMNLLLPMLLFSTAFMVPHDTIKGQVVVEQVAPNSPAAVSGIAPGDTLISIDGKLLNHNGDLRRQIQLRLGDEITIVVKHPDSTTETIRLVPRWRPPENEGAVGVLVATLNATNVTQSYPFWRAIPMGIVDSVETFVLFKNGIISMIIGTAPATVTGPVGIATLTGQVAQAGISPLLEFAAFLSINLGIFNLFPLPALDGGRMAFVLLEWMRRGKRISAKTEGMIHLIGFALLMIFILAITYGDILHIIRGESLLP